jgi:hypothetical protein
MEEKGEQRGYTSISSPPVLRALPDSTASWTNKEAVLL